MTPHALVLIAALAAGGLAQAQSPDRSPDGQGASPDMQAARAAARKACAADAQTLCPGKEGRVMMMCMRANLDKASPGCKEAAAKMRRHPQ